MTSTGQSLPERDPVEPVVGFFGSVIFGPSRLFWLADGAFLCGA